MCAIWICKVTDSNWIPWILDLHKLSRLSSGHLWEPPGSGHLWPFILQPFPFLSKLNTGEAVIPSSKWITGCWVLGSSQDRRKGKKGERKENGMETWWNLLIKNYINQKKEWNKMVKSIGEKIDTLEVIVVQLAGLLSCTILVVWRSKYYYSAGNKKDKEVISNIESLASCNPHKQCNSRRWGALFWRLRYFWLAPSESVEC